jgi:hypothetical protein
LLFEVNGHCFFAPRSICHRFDPKTGILGMSMTYFKYSELKPFARVVVMWLRTMGLVYTRVIPKAEWDVQCAAEEEARVLKIKQQARKELEASCKALGIPVPSVSLTPTQSDEEAKTAATALRKRNVAQSVDSKVKSPPSPTTSPRSPSSPSPRDNNSNNNGVDDNDDDNEGTVEMSNLTILNYTLKLIGSTHERRLTIIMLAVQAACSVFAFSIRYGIAFLLYDRID